MCVQSKDGFMGLYEGRNFDLSPGTYSYSAADSLKVVLDQNNHVIDFFFFFVTPRLFCRSIFVFFISLRIDLTFTLRYILLHITIHLH